MSRTIHLFDDKFHEQVAQIFGNFWGLVHMVTFKVKNALATFSVPFAKNGYVFFQHLVTLSKRLRFTWNSELL